MPKDDSPRRADLPPPVPEWSSLDYAWAAATALPLLACAPFFLVAPFWVGALIAPPDAAPPNS